MAGLVLSPWLAVTCRMRLDLRDEAGQCRASGLSRSHMDCRALAEKKSAQDLDEWSERHARGLGLEAVTANHQRSARARHRSQLGDKARLANSGFAPEKNQARLPPLCRIQPCLELGTLGHPADEDRARDAANHGPIMVQYNLRFNGVRSTSHGPTQSVPGARSMYRAEPQKDARRQLVT